MEIILGHMIGDYLFQSDWMAINKKAKGLKGLVACVTHCFIWALSVYLLGFRDTSQYNVLIFALLFLSHFVLDRTNFVKWYCNKTRIMPNPAVWKLIIVDNTLHLLMVYAIQFVLLF